MNAPRFSVVTACYNAAPWLDAYFQSLVGQALDFEKNIEVILINDGSTDDSAELAGVWAARYPGNIACLSQQNSGPAAARNLGLTHARGEWVTFIDPDDFLHEEYFSAVQRFLESEPDFTGLAVSANPVFFHERGGAFVNGHPLRYKYAEGNIVVDLRNRPEYVQLFASSCFFRREALARSGLLFDGRVRPSFEDGHLIYRLLVDTGNTRMAFLRDALYFYRQRANQDSLIGSGWKKREKYRDQLLFGYLALARHAKRRLGHVPEYVQYAIVYDLQWHVDRMLERQIPHVFTPEEGKTLFELLRLIFAHIDVESVLLSSLPMLQWGTRAAMLNAFKGLRPAGLPFLLRGVAKDRRSALLLRYTGEMEQCVCNTRQGSIEPLWEKRLNLEFRDEPLCVLHHMRFPLPPDDEPMSFAGNGVDAPLLCGGGIF
jgi:glycosyltransferase involved in cell wall biosynthesis